MSRPPASPTPARPSSTRPSHGASSPKRSTRSRVASQASPPVDRATIVAAAVASARSSLEKLGYLKLSALKPASIRPYVIAELGQSGFEITGTVVRRPLMEQIGQALQQRACLPMKSAHTFVAGATAAETRRAILALVQARKARIVLRTKAETLVGIDADVLTGDEIKAVRLQLSLLGKTLQRVSRTGATALGMLRADLFDRLADLPRRIASTASIDSRAESGSANEEEPRAGMTGRGGGQRPPTTQEPAARDETTEALLRAVDSSLDERFGMAFVPKIVRLLGPRLSREAAHALLVSAARRGLIELRPESGLGRLSEDEIAACPPGPQGTRLSWARRL